MRKKSDKYTFIVDFFSKTQPDVSSELNFGSAYELLVATMLAAQCTDKRVNIVTPALFNAYPCVSELAKATEEDILSYIKSVSYPNSKARHLRQMAQMVVEEFGGEIPCEIDSLTKLPGVGRKTANVMQAVWFGRAAMAVDTHVFRVSHRLGLVPERANTPLKVELELMRNIPAEDVPNAHHWLLLHGRYVCTSRKPHCEKCPFDGICPKRVES